MLRQLLQRTIQIGRLTVWTADGQRIQVGEDPPADPRLDVSVRLSGLWTSLKLARNPELYLGEAYMNGDLVLEQGTLWDLIDLLGRNLALRPLSRANGVQRLWRAMQRSLQQGNSPSSARRNVAHHYDLSDRLYRGFLDEDLQYSCAYFREPRLSLDEAQRAKVRHIIPKLLLQPGQRVLDIGCGWGALALAIAEMEGVCVTGITLSREQLHVCRDRARQLGLDHKVRFELRDYRELGDRYDRIVSVGMFEHVGSPNYAAYFRSISRLLADDGVALIHSIGSRIEPGLTNPWIRKYIFPGGYVPALSEATAAIERTGLWITDIEILRLHYAETLRCWRERFLRHAASLRETYDDRFVRMWEFYLAGSETGFRHADLMVFQVQLARRIDTLPITRDYLVEEERRLGAVRRAGASGAVSAAAPRRTRNRGEQRALTR